MPWSWGNAGSGAMSGAAAGTSVMPGWGTAIGGIAGGLMGGLSGGSDSSRKAMKEARGYLNQIPGTISPYYQPFINAGQQAMPGLQGMYNNMMNDPNAVIARLGAGYKESPGFQFSRNQALQGMTNAAAAGGMGGSRMHQQQSGELASNLASQDYNNYLQQVLGVMGGGIQGNQGFVNQGYGASHELAQGLMSHLMSHANLSYSGQLNKGQQQQGQMGNMMGMLPAMGSMMGNGGSGGAGMFSFGK